MFAAVNIAGEKKGRGLRGCCIRPGKWRLLNWEAGGLLNACSYYQSKDTCLLDRTRGRLGTSTGSSGWFSIYNNECGLLRDIMEVITEFVNPLQMFHLSRPTIFFSSLV